MTDFNSDILSLKEVPTLNRLTKYEKARVIGTRATQIQHGMPPIFKKNNNDLKNIKHLVKNSVHAARVELFLKSTPLIISRKYPFGRIEDIKIQDLE